MKTKTKTTGNFIADRLGICQAANIFRRQANQALVPTPVSVTPAACAPVAPATGAAEL